MRQETLGSLDYAVRQRKAYELCEIRVYALRAAHRYVVARGAYGAAYLRTEEQVQKRNYHDRGYAEEDERHRNVHLR